MSEERENIIQLTTVEQVVNAPFYNALRENYSMLAGLMWNKFKEYLVNDYFTDIERQTILMKFFEEQKDRTLIKEIIEYLNDCEFKDDYTKIIMEYIFHNSDDIVKDCLQQVDGAGFVDKKESNKATINLAPDNDEFMDLLTETLKALGESLDG